MTTVAQRNAVVAAVTLSVVSVSGFLLLPVLLSCVQTELQLGSQYSGLFGSLVMGGFGVAALISQRWVRRAAWRTVGVLLMCVQAISWCVLLIALDIGSLAAAAVAVSVGALAGGSGYSLALMVLAESARPARAFSYSVIFQVAFQMVGLSLLSDSIAVYGAQGLLLPLIVCSVFVSTLTRLLPQRAKQVPGVEPIGEPAAKRCKHWLALAGCGFFYLNIGAYWSYIKIYGLQAGIDSEQLANLLALGVSGGLFGALAATQFERSIQPVTAVMVAAAGSIVAALILLVPATPILLLASLTLYKFCWSFSLPFQYSLVATLDKQGSSVAVAPAFHGAGGALGPIAVVALLGVSGWLAVPLVVILAVGLSSGLFWLAVRRFSAG